MLNSTTTTFAATALAAMIGLILTVTPSIAAEASPAPAIVVTLDDGRFSYTAPGATLDQVLRAIAAEAGFALTIRGTLAAPARYATMTGVPVARAIRRLVGDRSMIMTFVAGESAAAFRPVAEVRITAPAAGHAGVVAANTAPETRADAATPDQPSQAERRRARRARLATAAQAQAVDARVETDG